MDELVHHCLRELSFDGDLGCNVSRLRDFIIGFYAAKDDSSQLVDDAFCAFVWSLVVQQSSVRVGTMPSGSVSEVYIAPQTSAKRKAAARGEEIANGIPPSLELVLDGRHRHLEDLKRDYGDSLRIAVDPETSFAAITGSHIRPPKLSPMVYSALQLVTRGREDGITTVELGRKTKYDQKTCFYLIKQLVELGLIVKVRRGGVGNHACIHKYFVERSALWQQIQEEETQEMVAISGERVNPPDASNKPADQDGSSQILFDPIDSRHLSSLPLVRNRIIKLLKVSRNNIHPSNNLLMTIGLVYPTKTDRRFFQTRLRELIQQGVVERILVPSSKTRDRTMKCIRLVTSDNQLPEGSVVVGQDAEDDERDASLAEDTSVRDEVKTNLTIHRQVSNMLEEAGPSGLTLNDICASLGNFDKRTIELLLTRASNSKPPAHLGDLGTVDFMETFGRERRHRYFTLAAYKSVMASERLQDTPASALDVDLSRIGDFVALDSNLFYLTATQLYSYQDSLKDGASARSKKRKRDEGSQGEESEPFLKRKRGRPRKTPVLTDTTSPRKRGRPRKNPIFKDREPQNTVLEGSSLRTLIEVNEVGEGRAPAGLTPTQVVVNSRPANELSNAGVALPGSVMGAGIVQSSHSDKSSHPSLKRARIVALNSNNHSTLRMESSDAIVSSGHRLSGRAPVKGNLSVLVAQEDIASTAICHPTPTAGQGSSETPDLHMGICGKHKDATPPLSPRPSKRSRTSGGGKTRSNINISALRRENELLKVIETMGGIANMQSKEIFDAHTELLDTMSRAKEPTSAPVGTRLDKRTGEAALKNLESRGRIRMVKTSLVAPSGVSRPACLVYLPDTPQEKVNVFLRQLSQSAPSSTMESIKVLDEPIEYGPDISSAHPVSLPLNLLQIEDQDDKENERLQQLFSYDSKTIRDVLLSERTTVAQLYGFLVGKALRLQRLHLYTLELFQQSPPTPSIISQEHRIIDISHFQHDITLALHCSLVAVVAHDDALDLLFSGHGKQTLVKDLSPNLHTSLGIGKSRSRSRILELMEMLRSLGLVTPLERTKAPDAPFKCSCSNGDIISFQKASLEGWSASTPALAPLFWHFHTSGSLYLWALSESSPPYWKEHPTSTPTEGKGYWDELYKLSRDQSYAQAAGCPSTSPPVPVKICAALGRCLRRRLSWDPKYALTWHQKQYLAMEMTTNTGETASNTNDMNARLDQISYVLSAPRHVVAGYYTVSSEKLVHDLEKARQRIKRSRKAEEDVEAKSTLRKKAEEARAQRERDWEDLLHQLHPEPVKGTLAVRIRAVRSRFMQSTLTMEESHWENEIQQALKENRLLSKKVTSQPKARLANNAHTTVTEPPPMVPNPPEKAVESLVTLQGPPTVPTTSMKKKRETKEGSEASRRPRFHWTREFDELARDASAIIRARCRTSRLDLSAFDQVFPAVPRNSVRQRITHLRECAAEDLYMKRLEDQWHTVWLRYRGTAHLPDEDPSSPSNFDLINHVEFLRRHVDKNALRVGFVERETPRKLPASVEELRSCYHVEEDVLASPSWDFMWGTTVEENREKQFRSQAFTREPDNICEDTKNEKVQLAEAALKMVFGTPGELYDSDSATRLLHSVGDQCVSVARSNLLHQGVLSKLVRDPKKAKPGRMLKISDANLNALGGPFPRDLFQDAVSLEDVAVERVVDEMEWPLISSEGDIATLLHLVSDGQVDFILDSSQSRVARQKIDWNSKRADDEDIETCVRVRFSPTSVASPGGNRDQRSESTAILSDPNTFGLETHGTTLDGKEAACAIGTEAGLINCSACINTAFATFTSGLSQSDREITNRILDRARTSREAGLDKTALGMEAQGEQHVLELVHEMTLTTPPILLWRYFNTPLLVAGDYCDTWGVTVSDEPLALVTPRRWLDIRGFRLDRSWRTAQEAVVGLIFLHPGITQTELRWRLRVAYDRQEIVDVLSSLQEDGILECRTDVNARTIQSLPGWLKTVSDDNVVFWFIAKNHHWYQI